MAYYRRRHQRRYVNPREKSKARAWIAQQTGGTGTDQNIGLYGADWRHAKGPQRAMRRSVGYRGKGAYFKPNKTIARGLRSAGQWLGHTLGYGYGVGPAAGAAGRHLAGSASKWLGFGAYEPQSTVSGNTLMVEAPETPSQQTIQINNTPNETGDVLMSQTEFIGNVIATRASSVGPGASEFSIQAFAVNPAVTDTFPFLSQIAKNFDLYDFEGLAFQYKPTSGETNLMSNSLGKVIMATNYDPSAPQFFNSVQMENYDYANSSKPSLGMVHGVETAKKQSVLNMLYTRAGDNTNKPLEFTDLGLFQIATEGVPLPDGVASTIVGELWVTYTVKLSRAQLYTSLIGDTQLNSNRNITTTPGFGIASFLFSKPSAEIQQFLDLTSRVDTGSQLEAAWTFTAAAASVSRYWMFSINYNGQIGIDAGTPTRKLEFQITGTTQKAHQITNFSIPTKFDPTLVCNNYGWTVLLDLQGGGGPTINSNIQYQGWQVGPTTTTVAERFIISPISKDFYDSYS